MYTIFRFVFTIDQVEYVRKRSCLHVHVHQDSCDLIIGLIPACQTAVTFVACSEEADKIKAQQTNPFLEEKINFN